MADLLKPAYRTVKEFMGGDSVPKVIPRYQRAYTWDSEEHVDQLLADIKDAMTGEKPYFIGAVLCIERGDKEGHHEIVDGQQRLITLSLAFASAIHLLENGDDAEIHEQIGRSPHAFISGLSSFVYHGGGLFDHGSLNDKDYRMTPGDSDKMAYRLLVKQGVSNAKHRRLADAYEACKDFHADLVAEGGYKYLLEFFDFLANKVTLVEILINDEENAYQIFEVLNARNKHLSPVDLIKNKLLSCFSDNESLLADAYEHWTVSLAACKDKPGQLQEYVRCFLQMQEGRQIAPKNLYKALREMLGKDAQQNARKLLQNMHTHCHKFSAVLSKDEHLWEGFDAGIKPAVGYLSDYRVVYTVMFSMLYAEKPKDFVLGAYNVLQTFMKRSRAVRDRFTVMEKYEEEFAGLAKKIANKKGPKTVKEFLAEIKQIDAKNLQVIPDEGFIEKLATRPPIKESNAKTMLVELANHLQRKHKKGSQVDPGTVTLEHILPKTPKMQEWAAFQNEDFASLYTGRLGNLTLLEGTQNTSASNRKFAEKKRRVYAADKCGLLLTNELCVFTEWTPESVMDRQRRLAELAAEVWKFPE